MRRSRTQKIVGDHLAEGRIIPGGEIARRIDQTLIQDATGTTVWQQFYSLGIPGVKRRRSYQCSR